jgi:hypothetical protein
MAEQVLNIQSTEKFETIELILKDKKIPGLVSNLRVKRSSLPEGVYALGIREGDESFYGQLKDYVWVDHIIDIILLERLELPECGLYLIEDENEKITEADYDLNYTGGFMSLSEFIQMNEQNTLLN